jgi:TolB-like protein
MPNQTRHLAAIMFTDIVGFTTLMGKDEDKAMEALRLNKKIHQSAIKKYNGKWLKEMGDGTLSSFKTISDAVYCAGQVINGCGINDIMLRIGIHQGEIIEIGDDIFGDGVNIASRLEPLAEPGQILVSGPIHRNIKNKPGIESTFLKEAELKNIDESIKIYSVKISGQKELGLDFSNQAQAKPTQEKSIAVLPFVNMSNDPDQDYFCDGLSEELLNVLAKLDKFKVAARTSSFIFKGSRLDIARIGKKLNVNTILEGSVRKSKNRMRITAQLINVHDGFHLWSERYDRETEDIFDIQDEIALAILDALKVKLLGSEKDETLKRSTDNPLAYDLYLKGRLNFHKFTPDGYLQGIEYYKGAIDIEPTYAKAYAGMASCYLNLWHFENIPSDKGLKQMRNATFKSMEFDDQIAESHLAMARYILWYEFNPEKAAKEFEKAMSYNPNIPDALSHYGFAVAFLGDKEKALALGAKAIELDPFSPMTNLDYASLNWQCERYDGLEEQSRKLIDLHPNFFGGYWFLAFYYWSVGKYEEAIDTFESVLDRISGIYIYSLLGCLYGIIGDKEKARKTIEEIDKLKEGKPGSNFSYSLVYAGMNDMAKFFMYLNKANKERTGLLIFLDILRRRLVPGFKNNAKLLEYMKKEGLPIYPF